jgi:hypothetical protein
MSNSSNKRFTWGAGDIRILSTPTKQQAKQKPPKASNPYAVLEAIHRKKMAAVAAKILSDQYDRIKRHLGSGG